MESNSLGGLFWVLYLLGVLLISTLAEIKRSRPENNNLWRCAMESTTKSILMELADCIVKRVHKRLLRRAARVLEASDLHEVYFVHQLSEQDRVRLLTILQSEVSTDDIKSTNLSS